mgnify:CR=1 FL=1
MVRLLPDIVAETLASDIVSIPQWCDCCILVAFFAIGLKLFQSHNGAIAARAINELEQFLKGFNPTMVRLLLHRFCSNILLTSGFNPTMVRLLPRKAGMTFTVRGVSIPQWCDCCPSKHLRPKSCLFAFNPTMVRLLPVLAFGRRNHKRTFNPTMVRLLPSADEAEWEVTESFNPTMVRLLRS